MAQNPYTDFPCHKTADYEEETDFSDGGFVHGQKSFTCAGFLSLQVNENGRGPKGFTPDADAFGDYWEMVEHHEEKYLMENPEYQPS